MCSKNQQKLETSSRSSILFAIKYFFILISTLPQESFQQTAINKFSIIEATCDYNYRSQNFYTCDLFVSAPVNPNDVLEITGTHLENHTDTDVQAVSHGIDVVAYFNGEVLRKFENLKEIRIVGDELKEINQNAFDVCPKLERLEIRYGQLTTLPSQMLKNCENLVYFEVSGQRITSIPEDLFGMTTNLEEFRMPNNQLSSLPEKLIQNMEKLRILSIGFNHLTELSPNFLINAANLEQVYAYDNEFRDQGNIAYALNGRTNLKYLMLDYNNFTNFDFRFFAQFQKLEELAIGSRWEAKLTGISWQSLPRSLVALGVYGIGEEIPENSLDRLVNLVSLTLTGWDIKVLHKDTFKSLTNLTFLSFYETSFKTLHPELFINQINLSNLLIKYSEIEELPPGIFAPLVNIGTRNGIEITQTKLRRLNSNSFGQHPHLQNIDFSFNDINEIERGIFNKFHPNMALANFLYNNCINKYFQGENIGDDESLELCYKNWEEIDPSKTTTEVPPSTPGGCGNNFKKFEVFFISVVGFFMILMLSV